MGCGIEVGFGAHFARKCLQRLLWRFRGWRCDVHVTEAFALGARSDFLHSSEGASLDFLDITRGDSAVETFGSPRFTSRIALRGEARCEVKETRKPTLMLQLNEKPRRGPRARREAAGRVRHSVVLLGTPLPGGGERRAGPATGPAPPGGRRLRRRKIGQI